MRGTGRMLALLTMLGAMLVFANGCSSVSLPSSLTSPSPAAVKRPDLVSQKKPGASAVAADIVWKKAPPSSENWDRLNDPVQPAGHKTLPIVRQEPAPLLELMPREKVEVVTPVQPVAMRHHGPRNAGKGAVMMAPPSAPNEASIVPLPAHRIKPPDMLLIVDTRNLLGSQPISGKYLVRADGTIGLGTTLAPPYLAVSLGISPALQVAGMTVDEARDTIVRALHAKMPKGPYKLEDPPKSGKFIEIVPPTFDELRASVNVDIFSNNSSVFYVIFDGAGLGDQVYRFPLTGGATVLDAISQIGPGNSMGQGKFPVESSMKRIWIARRSEGPGPRVGALPVDWKGITQAGDMATNYQLMEGDRLFVQADPVRRFNNNLAKYLEPVDRVMGTVLRVGQTANTFRSGQAGVGLVPTPLSAP